MRRRAPLVLSLCTLLSCGLGLTVPPGAEVTCTANDQCPDGYVCSVSLELCVLSGEDGVAPDVVAGSVNLTPAAANQGAHVTLTFTASEPLALRPVVRLNAPTPQTFTFESQTAEAYTYGIDVQANGLDGSWPVSATLVDAHGNESPNLALGSLTLDATIPAVSSAIDVAPTVLGRSGTVTVTFSVTENVAAPEVTLEWPAATRDLVQTGYDPLTRRYTYALALDGLEPEGLADVSVALVDAAGNLGSAFRPAPFATDHTGPGVLAGSLAVQLFAATTSYATQPTSATVGTRVWVVFGLDEAAGPDPAVTTGDGIALAQSSRVGNQTFIYEHVLQPATTYSQGVQTLAITSEDVLGNVRVNTIDAASLALSIDTASPATPATSVPGRVVFERHPWGSHAAGSGAHFYLRGSAASVTPTASADLSVLVFDQANVATAALLARTTAQADGSILPVPVGGGDRTTVYVAAMDAAGNVSDADSGTAGIQAVRVDDGVWIATFGNKLAGNIVSNPHVVLATSDALLAAEQDPSVTGEPDQAALDALTAIDDDGPAASQFVQWQLRDTPSATKPPRRASAGTTYDVDRDRVVMFGGTGITSGSCGDPGQLCRDTWEWDGSAWSHRQPIGASPPARSTSPLVYESARHRALLFGGSVPGNNVIGDTWAWDGARWTDLAPTGSTPQARLGHALAYDPVRNRVVLFGGKAPFTQQCNASGQEHCGDTWEFDGERWIPVTPAGASPFARQGHVMVYDPTLGAVVLYGGIAIAQGSSCEATGQPNWDAQCRANDTWVWNGSAWLDITPASGNPGGRSFAVGVYDAAHQEIVLFGGSRFLTPPAGVSDTWAFRRGAWVQRTPGGSPPPLSSTAFAYDSRRHQTVVFGGNTNSAAVCEGSNTCRDTYTWDGGSWNKRQGANVPTGRAQHTLTYDPVRQRAVLIGGSTSGGVDCDGSGALCQKIWEWDGYAWTMPTVVSGPTGRAQHTATFVNVGSRVGVLVFGGYNTPNCDGGASVNCTKTWLWNGAWQDVTPTDPAKSPSYRTGAQMAFDPVAERAVLFGGFGFASACTPTNANYCGDTWEWGNFGTGFCGNGESYCWSKVTPAHTPGYRGDMSMGTDPTGGVVLFGGAYAPGGPTTTYQETWRFNAGDWEQLSPATVPSPRSAASMAYDPSRPRLFMWGGNVGTTQIQETWEWTGANWRAVPPIGFQPTGQGYATTVFDSARRELFTFSGWQAYSTPTQEAWSLRADMGRRPGIVAVMSVGAAGIATSDVQSMQVQVVARGEGEAPGTDTPVYGARLWWWNDRNRAWDLADASFEATNVASTLDGLTAGHGNAANHVRGNGTTQLLVDPIGGSGRRLSGAEAMLDDLELQVVYRLGAGHTCGDGVVDPGEVCDDGDTSGGTNGCSATCTRTGFCGDGIVQSLFEGCEPPNSPTCSAGCAARPEACCEANDGPGCLAGGSGAITSCVCDVDPYCCDDRWDGRCVELVTALGCGGC